MHYVGIISWSVQMGPYPQPWLTDKFSEWYLKKWNNFFIELWNPYRFFSGDEIVKARQYFKEDIAKGWPIPRKEAVYRFLDLHNLKGVDWDSVKRCVWSVMQYQRKKLERASQQSQEN